MNKIRLALWVGISVMPVAAFVWLIQTPAQITPVTPSWVVALQVEITACADPSMGISALDKKCSDGSEPRRTIMEILSRRTESGDAVIRLTRDERLLLTVTPEGQLTSASGYEPFDAALTVWRAIASVYRNACPSLSQVLESVHPTQPGEQK